MRNKKNRPTRVVCYKETIEGKIRITYITIEDVLMRERARFKSDPYGSDADALDAFLSRNNAWIKEITDEDDV